MMHVVTNSVVRERTTYRTVLCARSGVRLEEAAGVQS